MSFVRMRQRGQVTLPKEVREAIGINEDTPLVLSVIGKSVVITQAQRNPLAELQKKVKKSAKEQGLTLDTVLKEIKNDRVAFNKKEYGV